LEATSKRPIICAHPIALKWKSHLELGSVSLNQDQDVRFWVPNNYKCVEPILTDAFFRRLYWLELNPKKAPWRWKHIFSASQSTCYESGVARLHCHKKIARPLMIGGILIRSINEQIGVSRAHQMRVCSIASASGLTIAGSFK
jgi:hypothetical protein